jgi:hypothetical protein
MKRTFARSATCVAAVVLGALVAAPAAHADTEVHSTCYTRGPHDGEYVTVCVGIDISVDHGHIRGWGYMIANDSVANVQIDKINLGNGATVLATTPGPKNSGTGGPISTETAAATAYCNTYYESRVY